ncbi:NADPH-dependent 7-cyano-7-deazaguanine reductase [Herbaspirillum rubrisubalbicans]|uniref:NADPH-dependent 7-cyano-7-deazaguanine reductase n=1 Tax=Herbaspirillum rubrisubalbicans TaxID=80842 RepID=A0ABX9BW41_9BURK|nr:NADPH-dependent 7-cyano-7-deazaguanine reductase QueF [Herbaspirillum rubrisubalbicans]MCP1574416.1 7-cyano-7-deazaguanine reductase [Herbaspirillum rubrisubalbicans]RAM62078.1 NADPH-dependent 7-cyano-7-deazaguanine reductase [Herbaspirillum rubrisubalbicans]RAN45265.1 NADPH-dependent 7-cyano-7-deazaguanine reductase [Herbaspirillum rubrisubalbicans]
MDHITPAASGPGHSPESSPLGKSSPYPTHYDPSLLFPIPRAPKRAELQISGTLPFFGADFWTAYEISWLNLRGKPQIAIASFMVPADSPNIIESKSFKLYLNSFNQERLENSEQLLDKLRTDLSAAAGANVQVSLTESAQFGQLQFGELSGLLLDRLDVDIEPISGNSHPDGSLLRANTEEATVEETLVSHLLKSNCPVTSQPDWGSVQIHYVGAPIDQERLLKYIIGFREHNEFHEQCVERIFTDILRHCKPQKLAVYARYTRRGGLDINPWRSNFSSAKPPSQLRNARQ